MATAVSTLSIALVMPDVRSATNSKALICTCAHVHLCTLVKSQTKSKLFPHKMLTG